MNILLSNIIYIIVITIYTYYFTLTYTAFGCDQLREVILPDTVRVIADSAFGNCVLLTAFRFPDSLREIGAHAFSRSGLSSFTAAHGEQIHAHGTAFDETPLCNQYRMIASSYSKENGYRIMHISYKNSSVILPAERFYFGKHAIYIKGAVGVKKLDCSACKHVSFDFEAVECKHSFAYGEPSHIPLTVILPKHRTGSVYFENCINVMYDDGTAWEGAFLPVSHEKGVTEYKLQLPALLAYSFTLPDEAVRLSGLNEWLDFEPNAVCSRTLREIIFGELRGRDRLFHRGCENLHHVVWKQKCCTDGSVTVETFEVYLPAENAIGHFTHEDFLSAFFGRYIQSSDTWQLFDSRQIDRMFMHHEAKPKHYTHNEYMNLINSGRKKQRRMVQPLTQKERIAIAVDVLRSTPSLFPQREMYDTYLRNHLHYALKISDLLPDDYAVFLKEYAQKHC